MTETMHMLEIYDLDDYSGDNPVMLSGQFIVNGPEGRKYYILNLNNAIEYENQQISRVAIRPHYDGDAIVKVIESICTVEIALPSNDTDYQEGKGYGFNDFVFWKVGKINPSNH